MKDKNNVGNHCNSCCYCRCHGHYNSGQQQAGPAAAAGRDVDRPGAQQPEEEPKEPEKPTFVDGVICPLGGEMIERADLYPRPVAVMLDNHPAARPQAGLEQAEVVYEILAEGNITRYLALYMHGADQMVGPVRSARSYYIDKCMEYNAIYLHAGGSPEAGTI